MLTNDPIELVTYNPQWPELAQREIALLRAGFSGIAIIDIQHVGSTAIVGVKAKPIIDIQIAVTSFYGIKQALIAELKALDYVFWPDNPDPERLFFVKGMPPFGEKRTHHVHIVAHSSNQWRDKIFFRDYLQTHADVARDYENLKIHLLNKYKYQREQYTEGKSCFINNVLALSQL